MAEKKKLEYPKTTMYAYDLSRLKKDEVFDALCRVVSEQEYQELMARRTKVFKGLLGMRPGQDRTMIFREVTRLDEKIKTKVFNMLCDYDHAQQNINNSRCITLAKYSRDFIKTPEQEEAYADFLRKMDVAIFVADVLESVIIEAQDKLKVIDRDAMLNETNALQTALTPLRDFSATHHSENEELNAIYCDYADQALDKLYPLAVLYAHDFDTKKRELQAQGKIDKDCRNTKY